MRCTICWFTWIAISANCCFIRCTRRPTPPWLGWRGRLCCALQHLMPSDHCMRPWHHAVVIRKRRQKCLSTRQVAATTQSKEDEVRGKEFQGKGKSKAVLRSSSKAVGEWCAGAAMRICQRNNGIWQSQRPIHQLPPWVCTGSPQQVAGQLKLMMVAHRAGVFWRWA